jgi:hypothetical protein
VTDELRAKIEKIIEEDRETYQEIVTLGIFTNRT